MERRGWPQPVSDRGAIQELRGRQGGQSHIMDIAQVEAALEAGEGHGHEGQEELSGPLADALGRIFRRKGIKSYTPPPKVLPMSSLGARRSIESSHVREYLTT